MKIKLYFLLLVVICSCTNNTKAKHPSNAFTLKGNYIGDLADTIFLTYKDADGKRIYQSAPIINGSFSFKDSISSPVQADLSSNQKAPPDSSGESNTVEVFLTPGEMTVNLRENDFEHAKITGSPTQDEWNSLVKSYASVSKIEDSLYSKMFALERAANTPKNHVTHVAIVAEIYKHKREIDKIDYHFISSHPQSFLSAYLLENYLGTDMQGDSIEMFYNPFSPAVKQSIAGKIVGREIANRKSSAPGSIVKMPSGINVDGSKFDPKAFKIDNYAILYFWAGWANDNARLKPVYSKYQAKGLKILAASTEEPKKTWLDSIKRNNISNWYNILCDSVGNLDTFYNTREMAPSLLLLVNKDHKIIGRYRGWDPVYKMQYQEGDLNDLDKKLAEVFADQNKH